MTPKPSIDLDLRGTKAHKAGTHGHIDPHHFIIHDAECPNSVGVGDLKGMFAYLARSKDKLWVHFAIDNDGYVAQAARINDLCYHAKGINSDSVGCELIGYAATTKKEWLTTHRIQLLELSKLIAWFCSRRRLRVNRRTVLMHREVLQGGHSDPGPNFPIRRVVRTARYYKRTGKMLPRRLGGLA